MNAFLELPPGPSQSPQIQTFRWYAHPVDLMTECHAAFGGRFTIDLTSTGRHVFFSDPATIKAIFTAPSDVLQAGVGNRAWLPFMGPGSLLSMDGEPHLRERRLLQPAFHGLRIKQFADVIFDCASRALAGWTPGDTRPLINVALQISLEVILRTVFGFSGGRRLKTMQRLVAQFTEAISAGLPAGTSAPFQKKLDQIDKLLYAEIAERKQSGAAGDDMLSMLLAARYEDGSAMSDAHLRDELISLLLAGHETTATAVAWTFYHLQRNPAVLDRVRDEAAGAEPSALTRLPYLDAACREALRLTPVVPMISRHVAQAITLEGYTLQPGTHAAACAWLTHRLESLYPDPERFLPERFLERRYTSYEWLPFGGGVRRCIGMDFALYEMKVVLGALLAHGQWEMPHDLRIVRRHVTLAPAGGAPIRYMGGK